MDDTSGKGNKMIKLCDNCGERFQPENPEFKLCPKCWKKIDPKGERIGKKCISCGRLFFPKPKSNVEICYQCYKKIYGIWWGYYGMGIEP